MEREYIDLTKDLKFYTLSDLEKILGLSRRTLQTYVHNGRLKAIKNGNKWVVSQKNLEQYLNGE